MNKLLTLVLCFFALNVFSQSNGWNKEEKNGVYLECISIIEKFEISEVTSKENLCLCYLSKVMDKYSLKEYDNKIDVEKKRLKDNNIQNCASELDISLSNEEQSLVKDSDKNIVNMEVEKENNPIVGVWSFEKGMFTFYQDNEYKYEGKIGKCRGVWSIQGKLLKINSKWCSNEKFELIKVEEDEIIIYRFRGRKLFHLKRQK